MALPSFSRHAKVNEFPLVIWLIENIDVGNNSANLTPTSFSAPISADISQI